MFPSIRFLLLSVLALLTVAGGWVLLPDAIHAGNQKARYRTFHGGKAIDGDTFFYRGKRYRIQQYNAPERGQPGAGRATRILQQKIDSGHYAWKPVAKDKFGRIIVRERKR